MKEKNKRKLPEGWESSKLSELADYINGKAFKPEDWEKEGIPIIRIENLTNKNASFNYYKGKCEDKYNVIDGDLLVSWSATLDAFIWKRGKAYLNQHIFKVKPFENKVNKKFFYFLLRYSMNKLRENIHGATMQHITKPKFDNFEVMHPKDTNGQIAIANELERKMAEVEKMRQAALRQKEAVSAMQGAILREVFPYKEGDKLPEGWQWKPLGDICFINPTKRKSFFREPLAQTSFVPMEAVDGLTGRVTKRITRPYSKISKGYTFFEEGDILFAKITPCMQNGKSAIVENVIDGIGFGSTEFHVLRPKAGVVKEWIYYFIRTAEFRKRAEDHFEGSAGQQRVPVDFVEKSLIPLPPTLDDQITVANELERKMAEIDKMRQVADRQLEAVEALPGAILREVFDEA